VSRLRACRKPNMLPSCQISLQGAVEHTADQVPLTVTQYDIFHVSLKQAEFLCLGYRPMSNARVFVNVFVIPCPSHFLPRALLRVACERPQCAGYRSLISCRSS
jgi:hypothetical protein